MSAWGPAPAWRRGLWATALALAVVIAAWAGRVSEGRQSLEVCDAAMKRGDAVEAIVLARAAAEARCPWCAAPELGYARLETIAKEGESRGDDPTAVAAWRAVRAAALATSVVSTSSSRRERADVEIARLERKIDAAAAAGGGGAPSPAASEEKLRAALSTSPLPAGTVFALVAVGGALFLVGAMRFARGRGFHATELAIALAGAAIAALGVLVF